SAAGTFLFAADPGGTGDIQVCPFVLLGETSQETGGGDGTGRAAADVLDIGEIAVQLGLIVVPDGQAPGPVVGLLARLQQAFGQLVVVGHETAGVVPQGNDAGAGESGDVDYRSRVEPFRVGEGIAQHQAAFGVGVEDFDSL